MRAATLGSGARRLSGADLAGLLAGSQRWCQGRSFANVCGILPHGSDSPQPPGTRMWMSAADLAPPRSQGRPCTSLRPGAFRACDPTSASRPLHQGLAAQVRWSGRRTDDSALGHRVAQRRVIREAVGALLVWAILSRQPVQHELRVVDVEHLDGRRSRPRPRSGARVSGRITVPVPAPPSCMLTARQCSVLKA